MNREFNVDFGINQAIVEEFYLRFLENPQSVDGKWRAYFERLSDDSAGSNGRHSAAEGGAAQAKANGSANGNGYAARTEIAKSVAAAEASATTAKASALVNAFRSRGHFFAKLDPLGLEASPTPELTADAFALSEQELDSRVSTDFGEVDGTLSVRELIARCEQTYCRTIAVEFMHIESTEEREWLRIRMESSLNHMALSPAMQRRILSKLIDAEGFEQFLHTKYIGVKRFSCEGSESMIPMVDLVIEEGARLGADEVLIGMAHRGRLNVLANILEKPVRDILAGFEDKNPEKNMGRGDVKYHMGYSHDRVTESGRVVHLSLAFNPSHLEFVGAVVVSHCPILLPVRWGGKRQKIGL